eukprot:532977-Rhodomonas_salina.1
MSIPRQRLFPVFWALCIALVSTCLPRFGSCRLMRVGADSHVQRARFAIAIISSALDVHDQSASSTLVVITALLPSQIHVTCLTRQHPVSRALHVSIQWHVSIESRVRQTRRALAG